MFLSQSPRSASFAEFSRPLIESGRYKTEEEVVLAAMEALSREEADDQAKAAYLKQALAAGDASGTFEGDPFEAVSRKMGWEPFA